MQRLPESTALRESFSNVRAFREDLDDIVAALVAANLEVSIQSEQYVFDSLTELCERRGNRPTEVAIVGVVKGADWQRVTITFRGGEALLQVVNSAAVGPISFQLRDELQRLQRHPWTHVRSILLLPAFVVTVVGGATMGRISRAATLTMLIASLACLFSGIAAGSLLMRSFGARLTHRHKGGFWRRNGEKIALLAIGALIGALVKWLFS